MTRWLPWLAGIVLVAGVASILVVVLGGWNTAKPLPPPGPSTPVQRPVTEKTVPLSSAARLVAGRFILTAVARRNVGEAYDLVGPQLRQGLTRAQWRTGNIPVVPYPVSLVQLAPMKVDFSYRNHALLEVALLPKDGAKVNGVKIKPQLFYLELQTYGKGRARHWVVIGWVPRGAPHIPVPVN
jgi:hypothetical protein